MKTKFFTIILSFLLFLCQKSFSQVTYPCGVYFIGMNGTSTDGGAWNQVYNSPDITLAAWIQLTDATYTGRRMEIFNRYDFSSGENTEISLAINESGEVVFKARITGASQLFDSVLFNLKPVIGKWYHVAVTFAGAGQCNTYVNGKPANSKGFAGPLSYINTGSAYSHYMTFGFKDGKNAGYSNFFKGYLDEAAYCQKALTASEVEALAGGITPGDPFIKDKSVAVYHKFDDYPSQPNYGTYGGTLPTSGQYYYCPALNKAPIANAGPDQTIILPTNSVTLSGNATPGTGSIVSGEWSKVSGPTGGDISDPTSETPVITNLQEGTYVFKLTITDDKGLTGTDEVSIKVNPLSYVLLDPFPIVSPFVLSQNDDDYHIQNIYKPPLSNADFSLMEKRNGVAADGVSKVVISIDNPKTLLIKSSSLNDGSLGTFKDESARNLNVTGESLNGKIRIIYYAPDGVDGNLNKSASRDVKLEVSDKDNPSQKTFITIKLVQPPIVLVHDTWGDETDWIKDRFAQYLEQAGVEVVELAAYRNVSDKSLEPELKIDVLGGIGGLFDLVNSPYNEILFRSQKAIQEMHSKGYASVRPDFIAHGVGGLRVRGYEQTKQLDPAPLFYKPKIHKLITIGTPHLGTRFGPVMYWGKKTRVLMDFYDVADKLHLDDVIKFPEWYDYIKDAVTSLDFVWGWVTNKKIGEAFRDLEPDLSKNETLKSYKANNIKIFSIGGDREPGNDSSFNFWNDIIFANNQYIFLTKENYFYSSYFVNPISVKSLNQEFNNKINDIFVPINSTQGGLPTANFFHAAGVVHSSSFVQDGTEVTLLGNPDIKQKTKDLLFSNTSLFSSSIPTPSDALNTGRVINLGSDKKDAKTIGEKDYTNGPDTSFISFDSVFAKKDYTPGGIVNIKVHLYNAAKVKSVYLLIAGLGIKVLSNIEPIETQLNLPSYVANGRLRMAVLGFSNSENIYADTISINVKNERQWDSILVFPKEIHLDTLIKETYINILGEFKEGTDSGLVNLNEYFSSNNFSNEIFAISKDGLVNAKKAGKDSFQISINGIKETVMVTVDSNYLFNKKYNSQINFQNINDIEYTTDPISLFATSTSNEDVNFTWEDGNAEINNNYIFIKDTGIVTIKASSLGNAYFNAAPDTSITFKITRAKQLLTFDTIPNHQLKDSGINLVATSNYNLPVQFFIRSGPAKLDSNKLVFTGLGTITIRAFQNGNEHYLPTYVDRIFVITSALPLTLLDFYGSLNTNKEAVLNWQTAQEINTSYFDIEHSVDGNNFSSIGQVSASGNSASQKNYSYIDLNPLQGINYYRLKIVDVDGKFTYSKVISVKNNTNDNLFRVFPNPANKILNVQASGANDIATLQIFDAGGRKLKEEKVVLNGNTSFSIEIKDLPKGVYNLLLKSKSKMEQQKFVKQ